MAPYRRVRAVPEAQRRPSIAPSPWWSHQPYRARSKNAAHPRNRGLAL